MKKIKQGYAISTDAKGRFFTTRSSAEKYIRRTNKTIPDDCQMKATDIYVTTNEK